MEKAGDVGEVTFLAWNPQITGASVKDDKDEPMDVDSSAEKDEKTKKPSETSGPATSAADSKPATKEPASVTAL